MNGNIVITAENLGKKYTLSQKNREDNDYLSLRESISNGISTSFHSLLKKGSRPLTSRKEDFWALKDISFEIDQGNRVGIIGSNGAGKSTLLKLLSRITEPTTGEIKIKGRVASLLEVGTGFHPELTGKENIYLNGAVLGMKRTEIRKKFDQIVSFAEVEKFLDTPVKRYSSGMYVRLAFSVAAHLEPEILIVDEVLAVGDERFQKKCLGRMEDIGNEGRTVIYVSHQMSTVSSLCNRAILLNKGEIASIGTPSQVIFDYFSGNDKNNSAFINYELENRYIGDEQAQLLEAFITNQQGSLISQAEISEPIEIHMKYRMLVDGLKSVPNFHFYRSDGTCAFVTSNSEQVEHKQGEHRATCTLPANFLNDGVYFIGLALTSFEKGVKIHFFQKDALMFNLRDSMQGTVGRIGWTGVIPGSVRPQLSWRIDDV